MKKKTEEVQNRKQYQVESVGGKAYVGKSFWDGQDETSRQGTEGLETLQLCPDIRKEAGKELAVLRTTFSDCPVFPDPFQRVEDHRDFLKLFVGGVILGTQIPGMEFPLQFSHRSAWRSQKNSQLWVFLQENPNPTHDSQHRVFNGFHSELDKQVRSVLPRILENSLWRL